MAGVGDASGDNSDFDVNAKSDTISENEGLIPQSSVYANQNENPTRMELVLNSPTIKQGYFTSRNHMVESKALMNDPATSDSIQNSWRRRYFLYPMLLDATVKGTNFTLEEVGEIITA